MKRSILYQIGSTESLDFESLAEEVQLAEELGIDAIWCFPTAGEDGGFRDGAPSIWLSALASRTERIRLGWGLAGMTPPVHPPIRMAEQAAAIDLASGGRLDVAFLPDGELIDQDEGAWDEGVRMLVDMWDEPRFSWTSPRFTVQPVDVVPKPAQNPHPPLWLAGWSAEHATRAGRAGLAFLDISGATDETLVLHRDAFTEARAGADPYDLVSVGLYGIAVDLESSPEGVERLIRWEDLGVDQVVVRAGTLDGGHAEACDRIRFLASEDARVH
jgi:alkanesulfonate monooxygenase SsuD/methylene tetrahydromethanopterin reductase-like flavin-dependent oxidoreductase (luciferase family)